LTGVRQPAILRRRSRSHQLAKAGGGFAVALV
jgi:hypothetical protein